MNSLTCVDLVAKSLLSNYWSNINAVTKYPNLSAVVEIFLLAFPSTYMVEAGFSHADAFLTK